MVFLWIVLSSENKKLFNYKYFWYDDHKTFKGFTNVSDNLDRKDYFKTFVGDKLIDKVPLSWKNLLVWVL